jgi:hypothetical protein
VGGRERKEYMGAIKTVKESVGGRERKAYKGGRERDFESEREEYKEGGRERYFESEREEYKEGGREREVNVGERGRCRRDRGYIVGGMGGKRERV